VRKHEQESLKIPIYLPFLEHPLRIDFSLSDCAVGRQSPAKPHRAAWGPGNVTILATESPGVRRLGTNRLRIETGLIAEL